MAMECGRRLKWTIDASTYKPSEKSETKERLKRDPIQKGILFESLLQFLACGSDDLPGNNVGDWDARYDVIEDILQNLKQNPKPFPNDYAKILDFSKRATDNIVGYTFETATIECVLEWVGDFIDHRLINEIKSGVWVAEKKAHGIIKTSLGEAKVNGRIDLFCYTDDGDGYIFEIKATDRESDSHFRQMEMYRQMTLQNDNFEVSNLNINLIRGGTIIKGNLNFALDQLTYTESEIKQGNPAPFVCSDCRVVSCNAREYSH